MKTIKFEMRDDNKSVALELNDADNTDKLAVIAGVFGIFGVSQAIRNILQMYQNAEEEKANSEEEKHYSSFAVFNEIAEAFEGLKEVQNRMDEAKEASNKSEGKIDRPKLIGSERTLSVNLGEKIAAVVEESEEKPYWYKTGIKFKNGLPHYRTRYWCQNDTCKHQGNQYERLSDRYTNCHNCGTKLTLRTATGIVDKEGVPERDRLGNFFRADKLYEDIER